MATVFVLKLTDGWKRYKSIRKSPIQPSKRFKDKTKYSRKQKHIKPLNLGD